MSLREALTAAWKFCLSFRKKEWELSDYPVVIRELNTDLDLGSDFRRVKQQRYLARVVKWWVLTGGGDTEQQVIRDLAARFDKMKADWQHQGKPFPRPGTQVPIEFAPSEHVRAHPELTDDFIKRVLGLDWAFVSDGSSLWDFHTNKSNDALHAKIKDTYGVDVSDIESGNLAEILDRIATNKRSERNA
jgi:hypothetical protein